MILFYPHNGCCEPQMGAKTKLGEDESISYYQNDTITPIIVVIWRASGQVAGLGAQRSMATAETAFLFVNSEVFDFFVERVAIDAKLNGGLGPRTSASSQNLLNEFTFNPINDFAVQASIFVCEFPQPLLYRPKR